MSIVEELLERSRSVAKSGAAYVKALAEVKEALAKSASTLAETDRAKLRAELDRVHLETLNQSAELEAAIVEQLG